MHATMSSNSNSQAGDSATAVDMDFRSAYHQYLVEHHTEDIEHILSAESADDHYSIVVEFADILQASDFLAHALHRNAIQQLRWFNEAAQELQQELHASSTDSDVSVKERMYIRVLVQGSPMACAEAHPTIGHIRVKEVGQLITLSGTVIRCGAMKMLEAEAQYKCAKCNHRFRAYPELEFGCSVALPSMCPSQRTNRCGGSTFQEIEHSTIRHDYQQVKIQEKTDALVVGSVPRSITVVLHDDLVDAVRAGDDVTVTGVLYAKWRPSAKDARCNLELILLANFLRKFNEIQSASNLSSQVVEDFKKFWAHFESTPLEGRNTVIRSICPQLYGLCAVKLAVALTLIGGVERVNGSGTRVRGQLHLLLVGDPGTGKSQFLKYAAKLSSRSVVTTGIGSSSAGLTVTAVKDRGEWMLEAGALVLADGGLCCIDEFDSMREADRATVHEAMEQQTISIAKAGLVTTLSTRTTVFGVMNPKGQFDPYQSLSVNTSLSNPLLSRFDIVLVLLDTKTQECDEIVSSHILSEHVSPAGAGDVKSLAPWPLPVLKSYIEYVKISFDPKLSAAAENVLVAYYQLQRKSGEQNAARTTIRMLESLIRLAQAHARLMFRNEVMEVDALAAVWCVELSMSSCHVIRRGGRGLYSTFEEQPDEKYATERCSILAKLQLSCDGGE